MALLHEINNGTEIFSVADDGSVKVNSAYTLPTEVTQYANYVLTAQTDGSTAWAADSIGMEDWIIAGDTGTTTITDGDTMTIAGGTNVTTAESGGTVTINSTDQYVGTVTSITLAADSGTGTAITTSGTFTFTGGTNVTTAVSGTTVTIDADLAGTVTGTGTANTVTKFTAASVIGDGPITFATNDSTFAGDITLDDDLNFSTNGFADISNTGTGAMRFKPSSQTLALTLTGANATFAGNVDSIDGNGYRLKNAANSANESGFIRSGLWKGNADRDPALFAETGLGLRFYAGGSANESLIIDSSGNSTFAGDVTLSSGYINITTDGTVAYGVLINSADQSHARLRINNTGTGGNAWSIMSGTSGVSNDGFAIRNETTTTTALQFTNSGNATFAGGITTTSATGIKIDTTGNAILELDGASGSTEAIIFRHSGTEVSRISHSNSTSLVFSTGSSVTTALTLDSSQNATFAGLVSGITPVNAANFTTKAYVDSFDPPTGTTQFFNQSSQYNNSTPGVTGYGNIVMDTSVSYYDTGKNVVVGTRGMVWTGKHYIFTDHWGSTAKFYNNNFDLITNPEASTITLPAPSSGGNVPHGAAWDGRYLYCINYSPMKIMAYDLDNGTTTATIVSETDISSYSTQTYAIEYAEGHLYTCADGKVSKFKVEGKTITHVFTSGVILGTIDAQAITYDGSYLWFTQNGLNAYKVSLDCVLVATITTGLPPNNIGWAWNGQNVATVNYSTGDVYVLNTAETRFDTEEFLVMGGNVGIGTTSPGTLHSVSYGTTKFHIDGGADRGQMILEGGNLAGIIFSDNGHTVNQRVFSTIVDGGDYQIKPLNDNGTSTAQGAAVTVLHGGNVGIGVSGPITKLEVEPSTGNSSIKTGTLEMQSYSVNNAWLADNIYYNGAFRLRSAGYGSQIYFGSGGNITFNRYPTGNAGDAVTSVPTMVLASNGNVGIGTTSPFSKLQVGNNTFSGGNGMHNDARVGISNHGALTGMMLASTYNGAAHPEYGLVFVQGPSTSSYNVWSISPDGPAKGSGLIFNYQAQSTNIHSPANAKVCFQGSTGYVGIGTTSPSYKLDVSGTIRATADVIAYSDKRVKENIITIDNALEKVIKLRGVKYTRKDIKDKSTKIGVIAQEVLEVLPEVVSKDDEGKYSVAYGNLAGVFIEAIKELKAEIEELKSNKCNCNK